MQANIFRVNNTKNIQPKFSGQSLKSRLVPAHRGKDHIQKYGRLPAPVGTDAMFDSVHEGIASVSQLKCPDAFRDFIDADRPCRNDRHVCHMIPRKGAGRFFTGNRWSFRRALRFVYGPYPAVRGSGTDGTSKSVRRRRERTPNGFSVRQIRCPMASQPTGEFLR